MGHACAARLLTLKVDEEEISRLSSYTIPACSCPKILRTVAHDPAGHAVTGDQPGGYDFEGGGAAYLESKWSRFESCWSGASSLRRIERARFVFLASSASRNFCCRIAKRTVWRARREGRSVPKGGASSQGEPHGEVGDGVLWKLVKETVDSVPLSRQDTGAEVGDGRRLEREARLGAKSVRRVPAPPKIFSSRFPSPRATLKPKKETHVYPISFSACSVSLTNSLLSTSLPGHSGLNPSSPSYSIASLRSPPSPPDDPSPFECPLDGA